MGCTVCQELVPADRIRLLARRDDLLFFEVDCGACGSSGLGFIGDVVADGFVADETDRLCGGPPVSSDDVLDMHAFLADWTGDLATVVRERTGGSERPARHRLHPAVRWAERPA